MDRFEWHRWFAWRPVVIGRNGNYREWVWWEWIERKVEDEIGFIMRYRLPTADCSERIGEERKC
jgi:hypothetical protein